ncbi:uncharacterized protein LTR77_001067 [Saxophila tyrrhenica]|uniref:Enoyl reductase (ER) domain-containing protein n=1 Tax=Saxophila tyrrhenica TaxID=1690608 RepID=A0AAV9PJ36_9PEZI|nr:hypothetical protein LTR77_001067 [Saxophila tyrrhenica]
MATLTQTQPVRTQHHIFVEPQPRTIEIPRPIIQEQPLAATHLALTVNEQLQYSLTQVSTPHLDEHEVLLRTKAVGLNPIDWKTVEYKFCMPELPWINGRECSAIVEGVGSGVKSLSKGQRVWTSTYYRDRRAGCFQDLVVAPEHTVIPMPRGVSFEGAASLGVCGLTAAMTIWKWFEVPMHRRRQTRSSSRDDRFALIWGGSTITGQFAIQIAAEAGFKVIAVASERTQRKLLDLGAHHVVARDGKSLAAIASEIERIGEDKIVLGIDLASPETAAVGVACLSKSQSARFAPLAMPSPPIDAPENVEIVNVEMKRFVLDPTSKQYAVRLASLVGQGRVKLPKVVALAGGLQDVEAGLRRIRGGDMGGSKLVVRMHG